MNQINVDIANALGLVYRKIDGSDFSRHSSVFLFGTENQSGVNEVLNYKDKDVFTVASSGDQYIGASYYGASKVDIFDINRNTYYMTCLKIAAIMVLDYKEFTDFFIPFDERGYIKRNFWNLETFKKMIYTLPYDIALFWDKVLYHVQKFGCGHLTSIQSEKYKIENVFRGMPFYNSEEEYYVLQAILRKKDFPKFVESDLYDLSKKLSCKYDIFYLSNIIECLDWMFRTPELKVSEIPSKFLPTGSKTAEKDLVLTYKKKK